MRPRFEPESTDFPLHSADARTDSAANASFPSDSGLKTPTVSSRFQVDSGELGSNPSQHPISTENEAPSAADDAVDPHPAEKPDVASSAPSPDQWRRELAAKLDHYRARKRAPSPRYPSLQLKFDEAAWNHRSAPPPEVPPTRLAVTMQSAAPELPPTFSPEPAEVEAIVPDQGAKILEFPRFFTTPLITFDELAEPVLDRPRILEVPEQLPPPPALGGISIEAQEQSPVERRPGFELPLNPPPMSRRVVAGMFDALLVLASFAGFAYIGCKIASTIPSLKEAAAVSVALIISFWAAYQYLFLVHSGTTPGLKLAKLSLTRFSGEPVPRTLRRWRVLASVLSGLSVGLGYAWCWLDEDQLCWHDRITRTYMAKDSAKPATQVEDPVTG